MKLNNRVKAVLITFCLALSVAGFLIKLPSFFRHVDKEMHTLFYFLAAAFMNLLFSNRNVVKHILIFLSLYLFGTAIEFAQEYSNKLLHRRIHGRYDTEDVHANLKGLVLFSMLWVIYTAVLFVYNKLKFREIENVKEEQ